MIQTHSNDPDVAAAAEDAARIVKDVLDALPSANDYDYGGHELKLGDYGVCERCAGPIAEAQQAQRALLAAAGQTEDETIKEHLAVAADLFRIEAEAAAVRAELHNGQHSEPILNELLSFIYNRSIHDSYDHSHAGQGGN